MDLISDSFFSLPQLSSFIFRLVGIALTAAIGILAIQKVPDTTGKLIAVGAFFKVISSLLGIFLQFFLVRMSNSSNWHFYFSFNSIISTLGHLLFLIGIFMLLKNLLFKEEYSD